MRKIIKNIGLIICAGLIVCCLPFIWIGNIGIFSAEVLIKCGNWIDKWGKQNSMKKIVLNYKVN